MELSVSILSMKNELKINEKIKELNKLNIDYLHIDIMDGKFVQDETWNVIELERMLSDNFKPLDIHLMVEDVNLYVSELSKLKPKYITFHLEAVNDPIKFINLIKQNGIKAGISIKPDTDVSCLLPYLEFVDLVLIMSVEPGKGGQKFLDNSVNKIDFLYEIRQEKKYNYTIEVDGGVNINTIDKCKDCDVVVVGSYITKNEYKQSINNLRTKFSEGEKK